MDGIWYYRHLGKLTGPIQFSELIAAAARGSFEATDEVRSGHSGWRKASTVPELSEALGVPVEQFVNETRNSVSEPEDLPSIDDFFNDSESPSPVEWNQAASAPSGLEQETQYFCRIEGQERGPLTLEELQELLDSSTIQIHERVRRTDSVAWIPCREISELDFDRVSTIHEQTPDTVDPIDDDDFGSTIQEQIPDPDDPSDDDGFDPNLLDQFEDCDPLDSILKDKHGQTSLEEEPAPRTAAVPLSPPTPAEPASRPRRETSPQPIRTPLPVEPQPRPLMSVLPPSHDETRAKPAKSRGFALPQFSASGGQLLFLGLAALFFVYMYALPKGTSELYGTVRMGDLPLPVGTVSLKSNSKEKNSAMTLSIFDGVFEAAEGTKIRPDKYEVVITIGNPLGMPVSQLEGTAFENLNGGKYRTELPAARIQSGDFDFTFSESSVELLKGKGELPDSKAPK